MCVYFFEEFRNKFVRPSEPYVGTNKQRLNDSLETVYEGPLWTNELVDSETDELCNCIVECEDLDAALAMAEISADPFLITDFPEEMLSRMNKIASNWKFSFGSPGTGNDVQFVHLFSGKKACLSLQSEAIKREMVNSKVCDEEEAKQPDSPDEPPAPEDEPQDPPDAPVGAAHGAHDEQPPNLVEQILDVILVVDEPPEIDELFPEDDPLPIEQPVVLDPAALPHPAPPANPQEYAHLLCHENLPPSDDEIDDAGDNPVQGQQDSSSSEEKSGDEAVMQNLPPKPDDDAKNAAGKKSQNPNSDSSDDEI